jgi:hypothetical protein
MKEIKDKFKDHVLTEVLNTDNIKIFDFRHSDCSIWYYQRWIINHGTLIVLGDCYDSIYKWNDSNISLEFLASCDLGYFSSKCKADKDGSNQELFDSSEAEKYLKLIASERILDEYSQFEDVDLTSLSDEEKFALVSPIIMEELDISEYELECLLFAENEYDAYEILNDRGYEFMFGIDGWEYGRGLMTLTWTPKHHLAALKAAYERYPDAF